jgi:hypothetical protein
MTLEPRLNKYVKYFGNIRVIQDYLCEQADLHLVSLVAFFPPSICLPHPLFPPEARLIILGARVRCYDQDSIMSVANLSELSFFLLLDEIVRFQKLITQTWIDPWRSYTAAFST